MLLLIAQTIKTDILRLYLRKTNKQELEKSKDNKINNREEVNRNKNNNQQENNKKNSD